MDGLAPTYDPRPVEERIYGRWQDSGAFGAPPDPAGQSRFSMVMPPPNVTGRLHMGHALDNALQDVFARWRRMAGEATLWMPGTDHAGIATQAVVERRLAAEGRYRRDMGRQAFTERIWAYKDEYERSIREQLRRLGCSCDWARMRFTLDPGLSRAVEEVFVRYFEDGLIYRGERIVNWCPGCGTAISDIEVDHVQQPGTLYRIRYALAGGGEVVIATVRPETMLGDTAVAVHPADARYTHLVGREAILPLVGRHLPIVADEHVMPEFGTGALKVTPAHDADDFAIAARHGLPAVAVIGTDARLTPEAGPDFAGLPVDRARPAVVRALRAAGALVGEEPYTVAVGRCERCDSVIEPLISLQWFVRVRPLVEPVLESLRAGDLRLVPERFRRIFEQGLENEHDWCISRQLWWGHRIPAWHCGACGHVTVARAAAAPDRCARCGTPEPTQDPDVLDTWFSSALWPLSTMGWPERTPELEAYYPTDLLVTGYDILFKWVMKMAWSGLRFEGRLPFRTVLLHGLVRDAQGRKMSKSLGNGVDPLEVIDRYGADALRLTLLSGVGPGNDSRFAPEKIEGSQRFCNKLWNAARFVLAHAEGPLEGSAPEEVADRWICSRLAAAATACDEALRRHDPGDALAGLHSFVWDEFCDWYVEATKHRLYGRAGEASAATARRVLRTVLDGMLRLLHPFAPFITEEIWGRLGSGLLLTAPWPDGRSWPRDLEAEASFAICRDIVVAVRRLRAEMRVSPGANVAVLVRGEGCEPVVRESLAILADLARIERCEVRALGDGEVGVSAVVGAGIEVVLLLDGLVDVQSELARLRTERDSAEAERRRTAERLGNPAFRGKARPEVVEREEVRLRGLESTVAVLEQRVEQLRGGRKER